MTHTILITGNNWPAPWSAGAGGSETLWLIKEEAERTKSEAIILSMEVIMVPTFQVKGKHICASREVKYSRFQVLWRNLLTYLKSRMSLSFFQLACTCMIPLKKFQYYVCWILHSLLVPCLKHCPDTKSEKIINSNRFLSPQPSKLLFFLAFLSTLEKMAFYRYKQQQQKPSMQEIKSTLVRVQFPRKQKFKRFLIYVTQTY